MLKPDGRSLLYLTVTALAKAEKWKHEYRRQTVELLQLTVKHGAHLHDSCCRLNLQTAHSRTLQALATFDGEDKFVVDLFRAGAGFRLLARCIGVFLAAIPWETKFTGLCQAAVLAGYVPSAGELQKLQLAAGRDYSAGHRCQQLVNCMVERRQTTGTKSTSSVSRCRQTTVVSCRSFQVHTSSHRATGCADCRLY